MGLPTPSLPYTVRPVVRAAFRYEDSDRREELTLVEWKHTGQYLREKEVKASKTSKATRDARYQRPFEDPDGRSTEMASPTTTPTWSRCIGSFGRHYELGGSRRPARPIPS
jgi:hypothetical protein